MTSEQDLLVELYEGLVAAHTPLGLSVDPIDTQQADIEAHRCGYRGVLAFIGDYVLIVLPDKGDLVASREVYRLLATRLEERGVIRHMVHPKNFASVKSTRRLGAKPVGYDADGYMHYVLTPDTFRPFEKFRPHCREEPSNGQEVATAEGP
jgi:hypothetical protein